MEMETLMQQDKKKKTPSFADYQAAAAETGRVEKDSAERAGKIVDLMSLMKSTFCTQSAFISELSFQFGLDCSGVNVSTQETKARARS